MPGDQEDLSRFSQKERDDCSELQEAFKRGDLICVGISPHVSSTGRLRAAKARLLQTGAKQPLTPVNATMDLEDEERDLEFSDRTKSKLDEVQPTKPMYKYGREKSGAEVVEAPTTSIVSQSNTGIVSISAIPGRDKKKKPGRKKTAIEKQTVTITPERAKEIINSVCRGVTDKNKACQNPPVAGYPYCVHHMPPDMLKEYRQKKEQRFFKE